MKNPFVLLLLLLLCQPAFAENITSIALPEGVTGPHGFCAFNNLLWFGAHDKENKIHLYKYDGSPAKVQQADTFTFPGEVRNGVVVNGKMYFTAGNGLWYCDGTAPVKIGSFFGDHAHSARVHNGYLLFIATTSFSSSSDLYALNLQQHTLSTLSALTGKGFSATAEYTIFNNKLYFPAGPGHSELWVSDFTNAGTHMVVDLNPTGSSDPSNLTVYGNRLYFSAEEDPYQSGDPHQYRPWSTDGTDTGTHLLKAISPTGVYPIVFANAGNKLLFNVRDWSRVMTYSTDGTTAGTDTLATALNLGSSFEYKGYLYCAGGIKQSLWRSDGTAGGTHEVVNFIHLADPQAFTIYNDKLYFKGTAPGATSYHLWSTDGGNSKGHIFPALSNSPLMNTKEFCEYNGGLYFAAFYDVPGVGLWKLDPFPTQVPALMNEVVLLYPNPATHELALTGLDRSAKHITVTLRNMTGQLIATLYEGSPAPALKMQLPAVATGVYTVDVFGDGQPMVQRQVMIYQ